jgi:hypothetical protein
MEDKMATKMAKAGVAIAAAALAAGVAGMFGGTALGEIPSTDGVTTTTTTTTVNNGPRCGINAFIPVDVLGVNMGSQFACAPGL